MRLAAKDWRVDFRVDEGRILVGDVVSGYKAKELASGADLALHREFVERFGAK
jgi:hypothetical protein